MLNIEKRWALRKPFLNGASLEDFFVFVGVKNPKELEEIELVQITGLEIFKRISIKSHGYNPKIESGFFSVELTYENNGNSRFFRARGNNIRETVISALLNAYEYLYRNPKS